MPVPPFRVKDILSVEDVQRIKQTLDLLVQLGDAEDIAPTSLEWRLDLEHAVYKLETLLERAYIKRKE